MSHRYQPPIDKDNETEEEEEASAEEAEEEELPEEVTPEEGVKQGFLDDPWPRMVFALMVLGFILVIFTPIDMWATYRYSLVGTYVFVILVVQALSLHSRYGRRIPDRVFVGEVCLTALPSLSA